MATYQRGKYWWYRFRFAGERIDEPTKSTSRTVAKEAERPHRPALEAGYNNFKQVRQARAREDHIKNLPVGQMEILMVDNREGTRYSHLHVRRAPRFQVEGLEPSLYPKMHSYLHPEVGVNLRFKEAENRKQRRRSPPLKPEAWRVSE